MQNVTITPKKTNHVFHLLLTVFTWGLWVPVWILITLCDQRRTQVDVAYTCAYPAPAVQQTPAPGWYPVAGGNAYWNGQGWTGGFRPFS